MSGTIMFLVHVHGQYLLYWEGVIAQVALMILLGDKAIIFSVNMLGKKTFLSEWKLALFTQYQCLFVYLVKNNMLSDSVFTEGVIFWSF